MQLGPVDNSQNLTPEILVAAYSQGYFPMPHPESGIVEWFQPNPRAVLDLDGFHCSRSLARKLKKGLFQSTRDQMFTEIMFRCSDRPDTWITHEFIGAYSRLHQLGLAHSVEVHKDGVLVGGLYGVHLGSAFFAESMFHLVTDASKAALYFLVERLRAQGFNLLEVQFLTPHLQSLGATEIPSEVYLAKLKEALRIPRDF